MCQSQILSSPLTAHQRNLPNDAALCWKTFLLMPVKSLHTTPFILSATDILREARRDVNISATTDASKGWHVLTNVVYHVHIMCLLAAFYLRRWRERWWNYKPTRLPYISGSFKDTWGHLQLTTINVYFSQEGSWIISICDPVDQNRHFKPNHHVFLILTKCVLCVAAGGQRS